MRGERFKKSGHGSAHIALGESPFGLYTHACTRIATKVYVSTHPPTHVCTRPRSFHERKEGERVKVFMGEGRLGPTASRAKLKRWVKGFECSTNAPLVGRCRRRLRSRIQRKRRCLWPRVISLRACVRGFE